MGAYDEVPDILPPYDTQFKIWEGEGRNYKQHDLVPEVGRAQTYSVVLHAPREAPVRFLTVQENRITNLMAHQPVPKASVFDKWGTYLGQGGGPLDAPGPHSGVEAVSMVELAMQGISPAVLEEMIEPTRTFLEPPTAEVMEVDYRLHRFWLREDLEVEVKLPLDLTDEEAERFAVFVTTLPLSARKSE